MPTILTLVAAAAVLLLFVRVAYFAPRTRPTAEELSACRATANDMLADAADEPEFFALSEAEIEDCVAPLFEQVHVERAERSTLYVHQSEMDWWLSDADTASR